MKKGYNPYLLPEWLRKTRCYVIAVMPAIIVFQLIRTIFLPTTFDFLFLCFLIGIWFLLKKEII